jgi:AcrR family transcriptional regulator
MAGMSPGSTSRADANRRRILDVALAELLRDPDASMDRIARAAGVVRRTVYGHFPSREALIGTLADEAVAALATADTAGREGVANPAGWDVADRYRLLVAPDQRTVALPGITERLAPVRENKVRLLRRGLDEGAFVSPLPAPALASVHERILVALMEAVNDDLLDPRAAGRSAAVTVLTASGVPAHLAVALVARVVGPATPPELD